MGFVVLATATKSESTRAIDRSKSFSDNRKWRDELHGIRGIAILLVVTFHIFGNGRVSGGIDIFLAITGFLAIPSLYRRAIAGGGFIPLTSRFGGLARRLLIPLVPVLIFIAVVGSFVLPQAFQPQMFAELRASALFAENIELVRSQLSYDAAGPQTSALQHLWSTSIQVQFHILMPFVFMLLTVPMVKTQRDPRKALIVALSILSVSSFAYAWWNQGVFQQANYFSTFSRLWELTLSGILGLTVSKFKLNDVARGFLSWLGILMILSTGFLFDGASVFPGPQALLPVGGLLLFLTAGKSYTKWGADNVVQLPPVKFLADISYSLYLWHWPIIIFYLNYFSKRNLGIFDALSVLTISVGLGTLGKKLFEDGLASWRILKNDKVTVPLAIIVMLSSAATFQWRIQVSDARLEQLIADAGDIQTGTNYIGALALTNGVEVMPQEPLPDPDVARKTLPSAYSFAPGNSETHESCITRSDSDNTFPTNCVFGSDDARKTVVMIGGSHVSQWWSAFEEMAKDYDWKLVLLERLDCQLGLDEDIHDPHLDISPYCIEWNRNAVNYIREIEPDLVVTLGTSQKFDDPEQIRESQKAAWYELEDTSLLLLRDNPRFDERPIECLEEKMQTDSLNDLSDCEISMDLFNYSQTFDHVQSAGFPQNSYYLDTAEILTVDRHFVPVIGNVIVWRDSHHITDLYARTSRNFFEDALTNFKPELFN